MANESNAWVMPYVWSRATGATPALQTSEANADLGAENVRDDPGVPWRTAGNFRVVSGSNDAIVFNEGGGNLTATLTAGSRAPAAMASHVQARMRAAVGAAGDETCTYDADTGKFTLSRPTGTFQLLWNNGAANADTLLGFAPNVDKTGALSYTSDVVVLHTAEVFLLDMDAVDPEFVTLGGVKYKYRVAVVTGYNDKLDYATSAGGAEVTATLDPGVYTLRELAAHIQTKLTGGIGCSYSSGNKAFTFSRVSIFELRFGTGTNRLTSMGPWIGFPHSTNSDATFDKTGSASYTGQNVARRVSHVYVAGHNFTESVKAYLVGHSAATELDAVASYAYSQQLTWREGPMPYPLPGVEIPPEKQFNRYWGLWIEDSANPDLFVEVGLFAAGAAHHFGRNFNAEYRVRRQEVADVVGRSDSGREFLVRRGAFRAAAVTFGELTESDAGYLDWLFEVYGVSYPTLWGLVSFNDNDGNAKARRTALWARREEDQELAYNVTGRADVDLLLKEVI